MDDGKNVAATLKGIREEIEILLCDNFGLSGKPGLEDEEGRFFGVRGLLKPRELTYLAYMLQMQHGIRFDIREYDDPRFYSISGLSEIVVEMVEEKSCKQ